MSNALPPLRRVEREQIYEEGRKAALTTPWRHCPYMRKDKAYAWFAGFESVDKTALGKTQQ